MDGLARERLLVAASLAALVVLAWLYLWREAAHMSGMTMAMPLAPTFVMWVVMMAGMMLPSATPTVLLYASMARKHAQRGTALRGTWIFVSGYLLVWTGFSLAAALVQAALERAALLAPGLASASAWLSGGLLVAAGLYQFTPLKEVCLGKCRSPVQFFMTQWRPGAAGALRMGISHGAYCLGCCWVLMLLLFAVGVMNLAWVALVAAFVLVEKLVSHGRVVGRIAGGALIVLGLVVLGKG